MTKFRCECEISDLCYLQKLCNSVIKDTINFLTLYKIHNSEKFEGAHSANHGQKLSLDLNVMLAVQNNSS